MSHIKTPDRDSEINSAATPFSTLIAAVASGDMATVEAQITDDIEWNQMPYNQKVIGKQEVMSWLKAGSASEKKPQIINNVLAGQWGVFEYWNVGTATRELIEFGKKHGWPFRKDPTSLIGQKYRVAQCFVYHLNSDGRINLMRQYLDSQVDGRSGHPARLIGSHENRHVCHFRERHDPSRMAPICEETFEARRGTCPRGGTWNRLGGYCIE